MLDRNYTDSNDFIYLKTNKNIFPGKLKSIFKSEKETSGNVLNESKQ